MAAPRPTAEDTRTYRDKHECSVFEAKDALLREWRNERLREIRLRAGELYAVEAVNDVLVELIEFLQDIHK